MKVTVIARNRSHEFSAASGSSCLQSGLAAGVDLPYECATGTCGNCRMRLVSGELMDRWPNAPGLASRKSHRDVLLCQCQPLGDCEFEHDGYVYSAAESSDRAQRYAGRFAGYERLNATVAKFAIKLDRSIRYLPGQFVTLEAASVPGARAYSMMNYASGTNRLEFLVKRKPGGAWTDWLFTHADIVIGEPVLVTGPLGKATFQPDARKQLLLVAGGSGLAGMLSIIDCALKEGYFEQFKGSLFFGVRRSEDLMCLDSLNETVKRSSAKLTVVIALSDEQPPYFLIEKFPDLHFAHGMVHEVMAHHMEGRYRNVRAYLAGPPPSVDAAKRILITQGKLAPSDILYDKFS